MRILPWAVCFVALASTGMAIWCYLRESAEPPEYLSVEAADRDLGRVPVGEARAVDFRVHNSGDRLLYVHTLHGELC